MRPAKILLLAPVLVSALPLVASAQNVFAKATGIFNIFVGMMLVAAILAYCTGFVLWIVRLGTWPTYRTAGIQVMEWSVVILFVLVVILMIVQLFRDHPYASSYTAALVVIGLIVWAMLAAAKSSASKKDEKRP
ncbi:MAG: hypothetical protein U1D26_03310 [Patescibacteria group bacterium]|nr:hypothetical protein [bacterium]MDZ4227480.1 hypothetical protein [Patescibacteria group bacterium]